MPLSNIPTPVFVHRMKVNRDILQNIFFCAPQKKVSHMGLKRCEGE